MEKISWTVYCLASAYNKCAGRRQVLLENWIRQGLEFHVRKREGPRHSRAHSGNTAADKRYICFLWTNIDLVGFMSRMPPVLLKVSRFSWLATMKPWLIAIIKYISLFSLLRGIEVSLRTHSRQKIQRWVYTSAFNFWSAQVKNLICQPGFQIKIKSNSNYLTRV